MLGSSNLLPSRAHARYIARAVDTELLQTNTPELFAEAILCAAETLRRGELVAVPTETVYGLAARADDEAAVARIYEAKGRPSFNPLIVHVSSMEMARALATFSATAERLAKAHWPGPLTLVLPRKQDARLAVAVTAGLDTVAIRIPRHPVMRGLLNKAELPLAAPSANRSGYVSPTSASHVLATLDGRIDAGVVRPLPDFSVRTGNTIGLSALQETGGKSIRPTQTTH